MGYKIAPREIAAVLSYKAVMHQDQASCSPEYVISMDNQGFLDLSHLSSYRMGLSDQKITKPS